MELIFATNNSHKLFEVKEKLRLINSNFRIFSLSDIGFENDIPETGSRLQENALLKAQTVYDFRVRALRQTQGTDTEPIEVFADDTGLEIEALNGEPGVYSAMYAEMYRGGDITRNTPNFDDNINLVLSQLQGKTNRRACFRTVIALILNGTDCKSAPAIHYFEGRIDGEILTEKHGIDGFGYDPIFRPDGYKETFAELALDEKNRISHRGRAIDKLVTFLNGLHFA
jgi:XTP/dITP diphosphohydrolase